MHNFGGVESYIMGWIDISTCIFGVYGGNYGEKEGVSSGENYMRIQMKLKLSMDLIFGSARSETEERK